MTLRQDTDTLQTFKTAAEVTARIDALATEIVTRYKSQAPLFVSLLRGSAAFTAQLMFAIARCDPDFHPEVDYMTVSTYGSGRQGSAPEIVMDLSPSTVVDGRVIVILDDILDKGLTSAFTRDHLLARGALRADLVVLAQKDTPRAHGETATLYGFLVPDAWIIGMGMDDARVARDGYRWLDYLAIADAA